MKTYFKCFILFLISSLIVLNANAYDRYLGIDKDGFAHYIVNNDINSYGRIKEAWIMRIVVKDKLKDRLGIDGYMLYLVNANCGNNTMFIERWMKWEETGKLLGEENYAPRYKRVVPRTWDEVWYDALCYG